ncbi:hypothetical protein, partial [Dictyobacter halimunensis]|uniref:hypothetical protein n=1 Tax=Dictyobacter halimunensis TaxID=3026934 RepID=UPI0030C7125C
YTKEYYLSLEKVAARMGHSLHSYDAPARLKAQAAIVAGMTQGVMAVSSHDDTIGQAASYSSDDELGDAEEHLF